MQLKALLSAAGVISRRYRARGLCTLLAAAALAPGIAAQTVVPELKVWVWALVPDPVDLTAGTDGALYAGRDLTGSGGGPDAATRIHHISPTAEVAGFGPNLDDPDTVWFDAAGVVASFPGSILVGGRDNGITPLQARVSAVAPDQTATVVFGPSTQLVNPAGMTADATGRLLVADFDTGNLVALVGSTLNVLVDGPARGAIDVVVHPVTGDLYISWGDGVIRRYSSAGILLDGSFGTGRAMEFGPGNPTFGSDLYTVDNATHVLKRIDPARNVTTLGTGFQDVWGLTFGTDGALYLTEFSKDRILRVSCRPVPGEVTNLRLAREDAGATLRFTWDDVAGASDYVVFQVSSPSSPFTTQTGSAATGVPGLGVPMPAGGLVFFQVGGRDACGVGVLNEP
jgi:sugar lactone lactonase YvrE